MDGALAKSKQVEMHWRCIALSSWHELGQGRHFAFLLGSIETNNHLADPFTFKWQAPWSCFGCRVSGSLHQWKTSCFWKLPHHLLDQLDTFSLESDSWVGCNKDKIWLEFIDVNSSVLKKTEFSNSRRLWDLGALKFSGYPIVVQLISHVRFFATPWTVTRQASLSFAISRSLLKLMSVELVMPSNHLILCHPLLLPSIFPSLRVFSNESTFCIRWPQYWNFNFQHQSFQWIFRVHFL